MVGIGYDVQFLRLVGLFVGILAEIARVGIFSATNNTRDGEIMIWANG